MEALQWPSGGVSSSASDAERRQKPGERERDEHQSELSQHNGPPTKRPLWTRHASRADLFPIPEADHWPASGGGQLSAERGELGSLVCSLEKSRLLAKCCGNCTSAKQSWSAFRASLPPKLVCFQSGPTSQSRRIFVSSSANLGAPLLPQASPLLLLQSGPSQRPRVPAGQPQKGGARTQFGPFR